MAEIVWATIQLYQRALKATLHSFVRGWIMAIAVVLFAVLMMIAMTLVGPLGFLGGLLLGAANALFIGMTLNLVEQVVRGTRRLMWQDVWGSVGQYFWDVLTVGFILWIPLQVLEIGTQANPYGPLLISAVFLLLFILLNPVPEVIYQVRHGSPLDVIRESYEFVIENWIEWFLPLAIVLAPFGFTFFLELSGQSGRLVGLDFFQLLMLPFTLLTAWLFYLGIPDPISSALVVILTPVFTVLMLIFRGHLFAALHGSSRRQRLFQVRSTST